VQRLPSIYTEPLLLQKISEFLFPYKLPFNFHHAKNYCSTSNHAHQLVKDFEKDYYAVMREVLYNIHTEFGIPMKLVRLIKMFK
jgi:hypothetical protein